MNRYNEATVQDMIAYHVNYAVGEAQKQLDMRVKQAEAQVQRFHEQSVASQKKAQVDSIIDRVSREGRLAPKLREGTHDRLMRADATTVIRKFTEGEKTLELTEFDLQVRELQSQPTLFNERMRNPGGGPEAEDAELAKVQNHLAMFSEQFGEDAPKVLTAFKLERDAKKKQGEVLRADTFLGL